MSGTRSLGFYGASYLRLLTTFRNGLAIALAHHQRAGYDQAVLWNGRALRNAPGRTGLPETIVEVYGMRAYTRNGFYDPKATHTVLDIGANVGIFSIWLAHQAPGIRVLAFEPFEENFAALKMNASHWRGIEVYPYAVGGSHGSASMRAVGERSIDHQLDRARKGDVTVLTLSEVADLAGADTTIDLLKMDIEGSEADVFEHGQSPDLMRRFRKIAIEWHEHLRAGVLDLLKTRLRPTHEIVAAQADDARYGLLQAIAR
jgi:FkbM family methyltransferase